MAAYRSWLQETDPVAPLATMRNPTVSIVHDSNYPGHGPLSHSIDFVGLSRASGNRPQFERIKERPPSRFMIKERQLAWLARHRRKDAQPLDFSSNNSGGPLSRVFAERFILVEAKGLALQAWFPHPAQPGKKVVLIGGHSPDAAVFGTMELALDGWFDYAIWENENGKPRLLHAGNFGDDFQ